MNRFIIFLLFGPFGLYSQNVNLSGIINRYAAVSAFDTCWGVLSVSDTTGFRPGEPLLIIQMQGAIMEETTSLAYGSVKSLNCAGCFEAVFMDSIAPGKIFLRHRPIHPYNWQTGKVQVVTIPRYAMATVTDTLKAKPWDGSTGGILVLDVFAGMLTMNAPISADGAGFRGGDIYNAPNNSCNPVFPQFSLFYGIPNWRGAYKGEGIAAPIVGKELGRGAQTNGGGGGNDHNSGGGGGGHLSAGGRGGRNDEPNILGCDGDFPGFGGLGISGPPQRAFMGGGGGAGHSNNTLSGKGGRGGGIVYLRAGSLLGTQQLITANGLPGGKTQGDGAGGGGAGGTVWVSIPNPPPNITLSALGGDGGDTENNTSNRCYGPGGGGAGGRLVTNLWSGIPATAVVPGKAGFVRNSTAACNNAQNGAEAGAQGQVEGLVTLAPPDLRPYRPTILVQPRPVTLCAGRTADFSVLVSPGDWTYQWQIDTGSGFQDLAIGPTISGVRSPNLQWVPSIADHNAKVRCMISKIGPCVPIPSQAALLQVNPVPTADFSFVVPNNDRTVTFTGQITQAQGQSWDFGDGNTSQNPNPVYTFAQNGTYTVVLRAWNNCDTVTVQKNITVSKLVLPAAVFTVPDTVRSCGKASIAFEHRSIQADAVRWLFPGGTPSNSADVAPSVQYNTSGTYTATLIATNADGADTLTRSFVVQVFPLPIATFTTSLTARTVQTTGNAQYTTTHTWLFGDGSAPKQGPNATHTYGQAGKYVVTYTAANGCGAVTTQRRVTVN